MSGICSRNASSCEREFSKTNNLGLHSSAFLHRADWQLLTDVSGAVPSSRFRQSKKNAGKRRECRRG